MRDRINEMNTFKEKNNIGFPAFIYQNTKGEGVCITAVSKYDNVIDLKKDGLFVDYDDITCVGEVTMFVERLTE